MKLKSIRISEISSKPLLEDLELNFPERDANYLNANCLIGVNGSGKSQFLETIAEIFIYLDSLYRKANVLKSTPAPFSFEITYYITIKGKKNLVNIVQKNKSLKLPTISITDENNNLISPKEDKIDSYLPEKVIGYTSGENETISIPFHAYYDVYATYTANRAIEGSSRKDYEPRFYFMDYNTNLGIVISNLVFEEVEGIDYLKKELKIDKLKSFQLILQTNQVAAPKIKTASGESGVILTDELKKWRENLIASATCYDYDEKHNKYTLDFYFNDATKDALTYFFTSAYNLYTALYKFELLNNLMIDATTRKNIERERKRRKLITKMPTVANKDKVLNYSELKLKLSNDQIIDYLSLSDGEHQFFNIFGTIIMVSHNNSLFLLDEPETHFNPRWRRLFISHLKNLTKDRKQDLFLTSHSPFIVSDTPKESVYIFERESKDNISIRPPDQETFGASLDHILRMAFDMDETMSEEALQVLNALKEETDPAKIEEGIEKLGESSQLMPLYRRIEMLSKKK
jgi:restriction system-associated AAA family ATPase